MHEITTVDKIADVFRLVLWISLVRQGVSLVQTYTSIYWGSWLLGMYVGSYFYKGIRGIIFFFVEKIFGLEALIAGDLVFVRGESHKNTSNLIGACFMEKFDNFEDYKAHIIKRTANVHRGRVYLTKYFNQYFY